MNRQHVVIALAIVVLALAFIPHAPVAHARPLARFDGNQVDDLVIGVPYEAIGSQTTAGAVHALYGNPGTGLDAGGSQMWYQGLEGVLETAETGDEFGFALAVADFDGDGYRDLAVGVHGEAIGSILTGGSVHLFYGTAAGLAASSNKLLHQGVSGMNETAEADDRFGWSLAAGDFDADGYGDLAVGVLWEDVGNPAVPNAGAVHVIYGSPAGLTATGSQVWYQGSGGLQDIPEAQDQFGQALGTGDLNGDGYDDLAIGVPLEDVGGLADAGVLHILFGSASGVTSESSRLWAQGNDNGSLTGDCEAGDHFAQTIATGDFNRDGYDDAALGVPYEDVGSPVVDNAGAVHFVYGSASGLTSVGDWLHIQPTAGPVAPEADDNLGLSLASGDFDGNGYADVAAGVPGEEDSLATSNAGAVQIVYFPNTPVVIQIWDQDDNGVQDLAEAGDGFGTSLAAGDFDGDGYADLAVGVPWEDILDPVIQDAGVVQILNGSASGIVGDDGFWHQAITGMDGAPEAQDRFGLSLAASLTVRLKIYLPVVQRHS